MDAAPKAIDKIAAEQVQYCQRDPVAWVENLVTSNPRRELIHMVYVDFVVRKLITPLEAQTDDVKWFYWGMAKKEAAGRLTLYPLKTLSKCLYWIEIQLNNI